jgi:hypothetical protein
VHHVDRAMTASVSVALCTYNGAAYIDEQLKSILDQTLLPSEIVVSDDGSTDGTPDRVAEIIEDWRTSHPGETLSVRILRNPAPLGVTANFEQALAACAGDLVALSDQDDSWSAGKLQRLVTEFARHPDLLLVHTDARIVDGRGAPTGERLLATLYVSPAEVAALHSGSGIRTLLRRNVVTGATVMLRRELVKASRPFPVSWVHDEWLAVVAAATGGIDLIEEPLIDYRQHGGNQIGATSLDTAGKIARLREPRTARNARLLARAEVLDQRAPGLSPAPTDEVLAAIRGKLAHERMRSALPAPRIGRVGPVLRAWRSGAYARFGLGLPDVARDLVQPV